MIKINDNIIKIDTDKTTLILKRHTKYIEKLYYGVSLANQENFDILSRDNVEDYHGSMDDEDTISTIFSSNGDGNHNEHIISLRNQENRFIYRFYPIDVQIIRNHQIEGLPQGRNKHQTLKIIYKEESLDLYVNYFISTYKDLEILSFNTEVVNNTNMSIDILRLMSLQIDFNPNTSTLFSFDGRWLKERHLNETVIKTGKFEIESKTGHSSNHHNPLTILHVENEGYFAANLIYSGNHKTIINKSMFDSTRYIVGMNDYMFKKKLEQGQSFSSVEAILTFSKDLEGITSQMHDFVNSSIIPKRFRDFDRPILINNWEATYFDFDNKKIKEIAKTGANVGIELFVLDDGWFGSRNDDKSGLGDWYDNKKKTGNLKKLSKEIKDMGLKFGLWFEPEMISKDSNLYRENPHFTMKVSGLEPIEKRDQYMLDLTNKNVTNYLYERLESFIVDLDLDYIKWDCNRYFSDVNSYYNEYQSNYYHEYFLAFYDLVNKITNNYPNVLFESCSAGGNRFDLGLLYYMPQTWASDNTDAYDRLFIQEGTLYGYPQLTLGTHVSAVPNHQTLNTTSLENRFNIGSLGAFGYELDLSKLTNVAIDTIKKQVMFYKENRKLLQHGKYHRIESIFKSKYSSWIIVNTDKTEAISTIVVSKKETNWKRPRFKFTGLEDDYLYELTIREQTNIEEKFKPLIASGRLLNQYGLDLGDFYKTTDREENSGSLESRMFIIKKI